MIQLAISYLNYAPASIGWVSWALIVIFYIGTRDENILRFPRGIALSREKALRGLLYAVVGIIVLDATLATIIQYVVWSGSEFTSMLLHSPLKKTFDDGFIRNLFANKNGYFVFFVLVGIWLEVVLSFLGAFLFWSVLKVLKRHKERFFEEGEVTLGLLAALLAGWPNVLLFVIFTFLSVVIVSLFRMIFMKEAYTTLGAPFLLALLLTIIAGPYFIGLFGLSSMELMSSVPPA